MNQLFEYISHNTLIEESLEILIAQGFDIDQIDQQLGTTPLLWAYDKRNHAAIKLLLQNGANMDIEDAQGNTLKKLAHERNDIYMGLIVSQYRGRSDVLTQSRKQKAEWKTQEEEYQKKMRDELSNQKINVYKTLEEHSITLDPLEPEYPALRNLMDQITVFQYNIMRRTIERLVATDSVLKAYPELLSLVEKITVLKYTMDLGGGNADDKCESATIELATTDTHCFVYSYRYNWSYGDAQLDFCWYTNEKAIQVWNICERYDIASFSDEVQQTMNSLAQALGLGHLPLEHFIRFIIIILSRMVQTNWFDKIEDHGIYLRMYR